MSVLIIDDEADIRLIAQLSLEAVGGFQVHLASSAVDGMLLAQEHRPEVILLDMMMPEMDGLSALAEIRRTVGISDIPVVFMTARAQRHEIEHYLQMGALGVIQKPFDPMTLATDVRRILLGAANSP